MPFSRLIIGCSRANSLNNPTPLAEIRAMWEAAIDVGISRFDTANIYGQGDSERALGRLARDHSDRDISITSKVGYRHGIKADVVRAFKPILRPIVLYRAAGAEMVTRVRSQLDNQDFTSRAMADSLAGSLKRLSLSRVNSLLLHDPHARALADPQVGAFLQQQLEVGSALKVGVALPDGAGLRAAMAIASVSQIQIPVTAWEQIRGTDLADELVARGISVQVRQIMNRPDGKKVHLEQALDKLLSDSRVEGILLGISRRRNLDSLLNAIDK